MVNIEKRMFSSYIKKFNYQKYIRIILEYMKGKLFNK